MFIEITFLQCHLNILYKLRKYKQDCIKLNLLKLLDQIMYLIKS